MLRLAFVLPALLACPAFAAGDFDRRFAGDGIAILDAGQGGEDALDAGLVDAAGRPVGAGNRITPAGRAAVLVRWTANGLRDASFGDDGIVLTAPEGATLTSWRALLELQDGRLLAAGSLLDGEGTQALLCRFDAGGALDPAFGKEGCLRPVIEADTVLDDVDRLALQADGRVVFAGTVVRAGNGGKFEWYVARILEDGSYDTCFGDVTCQAGGVRLSPGNYDELSVGGLDIGPDGRIVVAGSAEDAADLDMAAVRLLPTGSLDPGFAGDGDQLFDLEDQYDDFAADVEVLPDNRVLLIGSFGTAGGTLPAVGALTAQGHLDGAYGSLGCTVLPFDDVSPTQLVRDADLQPDGSLVFTGYTNAGGNSNCAVARLDPAGDPDTRFGIGGVRVIDTSFGEIPGMRDFCAAVDARAEAIFAFGSTGIDNPGQDGFVAKLDAAGIFRNGFED